MLAGELADWLPALRRYAVTKVPFGEVDDLVGDAVVKCLRAQQRGQTIHAGYAFCALRSVIVDWYASDAGRTVTRSRSLEALGLWWYAGVEPEGPETPLLEEPLVAGLTPDQRMVVCLRAEGYSHREIAETVGSTEAACKKRLCRAREQLRTYGSRVA